MIGNSINGALGGGGVGELFDSTYPDGVLKEYSLTHIDQRSKAEFEAWAKKKARLELATSKEYLSPEMYQEDYRFFCDRITAGAYNWGKIGNPTSMGSALREMMFQGDGKLRLTAILLRYRHGELDDEQVLGIVSGADGLCFAWAFCAALNIPLSEIGSKLTDPNSPTPPIRNTAGKWTKEVKGMESTTV